jgi:hypothetical protein
MQVEKKESNRLYKGEWVGDTYHMRCTDGVEVNFNLGRASVKQHDNLKRYGAEVKCNRFFAVSIEEFPTLKARMEEGRRRFMEWQEWVYAGNDEWAMPKKGGLTRGPSRDDCVEALNRAYPGKGELAFERRLNETRGDKTPELATIENVKYWLQTKQVAAAWAEIQAERKAKSAESFGDADDEVARLLAGE